MAEIVNVEQAASWDGPSGAAWVAREQFQNAALAAHTELLMAAASVQPADHVLDVGCGTGDTTRTCARLAADGDAHGVDLSTAMLARARERAAAEGVTNVTFEQADAQVHRFPDARFDLVLSRFGVMFFADPLAAFANLARASRPGARFAAVVWQPVARNAWLQVPRAALAIGRELPPVPEDVPGPFGLADADRVHRILGQAGWSDVHLDDARVSYDYGTDPATAARHASEIGVLRGLLQDLDDAQTTRAMAALTDAMVEHHTAEGVHLDSRVWVVSAVR
ncbi:MAG TPA: methyltransferase domain-containing protein [Acidimicrobiia bacterium]|jgi:SAM-dependent methyltransferase|nr:methyltransferase domain-containing protein [Acidimicrobiia bacterium]